MVDEVMDKMNVKIVIVPLTRCYVFDFIEDWRRMVYDVLARIFTDVEVDVWPEILKIPLSCFDWTRKQYIGPCILKHLYVSFTDMIRTGVFLIGIGYIDAYDNGLNFVFGEASPANRVAFVSTQRLDPAFYNIGRVESGRYDLYVERVSKEIIHELGHLFGLNHCSSPDCVMSFSNSVYDVDRKSMYFCSQCSKRILENIG